MTRRTVVGGVGFLGAAALSGCTVSDLTTRKTVDPQAPDRARLAQARDLSVHLRAAWSASGAGDAQATKLIDLHAQQITAFEHSAGLPVPLLQASPGAAAGPKALIERERALATTFRSLALHAQRGDVAELLASAAAGIDQALTA